MIIKTRSQRVLPFLQFYAFSHVNLSYSSCWSRAVAVSYDNLVLKNITVLRYRGKGDLKTPYRTQSFLWNRAFWTKFLRKSASD